MKIDILCVGKLKESYWRDAVQEYAKRLSAYCTLRILEVSDEQTKENMTPVQEEAVKEKEGKRLISLMSGNRQKENVPLRHGTGTDTFIFSLEIQGKEMSSPGLADKLQNLTLSGCSHLIFIIGGSLGLSREVCRNADFALSFSPMTFPHQMMRVILLEQIYRCFRINTHAPYHK